MGFKTIDILIKSHEETLAIGQNRDLWIIEHEGFDSSDIANNLSNNLMFPGSRIKQKHIEHRRLSLVIKDPLVSNAEKTRNQMIAFFNPYYPLEISVDYCGVKRMILCELDGFKEKERNLWEPFECKIDFICEDPFFMDLEVTRIDLSKWEGGLRFPFSTPFKLKHRTEPILTIVNDGHVEAPMLMTFKGPAKRPKILNVTTGDFVQINKPLAFDENLVINTQDGRKSIVIDKNGVTSNAYHYINLDSKLDMKLCHGDNVLKYFNDDDERIINEVEIVFKRRYLGV